MERIFSFIMYTMLFVVAFAISGILFLSLQPQFHNYLSIIPATVAGILAVYASKQVVRRI